ncbi:MULTISPECIES: acetylornithine transaminase [unclassified Amycolatopsis]|uniref:acetylornithine transaminase n=1 Tax=unclassified Amycolatopsis TaxID=2618356 RepID=UPI0028753571|nr:MULTISPECIES: acetylornithine transaminase [unclassified Amycolatopsis]MDS0139826.1 acetylornithine transaminase [Amycolatopsis sp. 505]MDS0148262.1 acetylornithine transaminase [Amycolatopsis sp. CM201R]
MTDLESNVDGQAHWQSALMDNYGTPKLTLVRGEGAKVWDADGKEYVDLVGGIAVNALGHAHPAVVEAVTEQIQRLGHTSNLYVNPVAVELAEALLDVAGLTGHGKVLFVNSGAEANEAALKISRLTGRTKVVAAEGAFHGRTMGALTLTGQPAKRDAFKPLVPGVEHVPFGDVEALKAAVDTETAAVFLEPVLGEAGVIPAPDGYLQAAREITKATGTLLVLDEVQTGLGRLGTWFGYQQAGIVPDVITLAKGLGGGLPLGAVIGVGAAGDLLKPGQHGTTFGGNPVCCAAGLAVLKTIAAEGLLDHVASLGKDIAAGVEALGHPLVAGVRGAGLLLGIALKQPVSAAVAQAAQDAGYLVNPVAPDTVRLAPPLVLDGDQAEGFLAALPNALDSTTKDSD